jgi:hypothetical protein
MQLTTTIRYRFGEQSSAVVPLLEFLALNIRGVIRGFAQNFNASKLLLLLVGYTAGLPGTALSSLAAETAPLEYKVKAAFLYNFAKFVEWPAAKFPQPTSPFIIGVVGEDPFGNTLDETVKGKTINGRTIQIRRFASGEDLRQCHLLFVSRSLKDPLDTTLAGLKSESVLTVGETGQFVHQGGMINFIIVDDCVKFEINLDTTEQAGLKVSSKLSSVARVVKSKTVNPD